MDKHLKSELSSLKNEITNGLKSLELVVATVSNRISQLEAECDITPYPQEVRDIISSEKKDNDRSELLYKLSSIVDQFDLVAARLNDSRLSPLYGKIKQSIYAYMQNDNELKFLFNGFEADISKAYAKIDETNDRPDLDLLFNTELQNLHTELMKHSDRKSFVIDTKISKEDVGAYSEVIKMAMKMDNIEIPVEYDGKIEGLDEARQWVKQLDEGAERVRKRKENFNKEDLKVLISEQKIQKAHDLIKSLDFGETKSTKQDSNDFNDPLSDKDLIKIMENIGHSDDDFYQEFYKSWNKGRDKRVTLLTDAITLFCSDVQKKDGLTIKVFDIHSATYALDEFNKFETTKENIIHACDDFKTSLNDPSMDFISYHEKVNNLFMNVKRISTTFDAKTSQTSQQPVYDRLLGLLISMMEQQELEFFESPKFFDPQTFESKDSFEGEQLKKYRVVQLGEYKKNLKKAYEIHFSEKNKKNVA